MFEGFPPLIFILKITLEATNLHQMQNYPWPYCTRNNRKTHKLQACCTEEWFASTVNKTDVIKLDLQSSTGFRKKHHYHPAQENLHKTTPHAWDGQIYIFQKRALKFTGSFAYFLPAIQKFSVINLIVIGVNQTA